MEESRPQSLFRDAIFLAFFILPFVYVGEILAVALHEILGHGLTAVALGGTFHGFVLKWDGMGWAYASLAPDAPVTDNVVQLAAGVITTTLAGVVFLILACVFRKRSSVQLPLLIFSFACLMEGVFRTHKRHRTWR